MEKDERDQFEFILDAANAFADNEPDTGKFLRLEPDLARLDEFYVAKVVLEQR